MRVSTRLCMAGVYVSLHEHVSLSVYVHVRLSLCVYACVFTVSLCLCAMCVYLSLYVYSTCACVSISLCIYMCLYLSVYIHERERDYVCMCVYLSVYMHAEGLCIHVCISLCVHLLVRSGDIAGHRLHFVLVRSGQPQPRTHMQCSRTFGDRGRLQRQRLCHHTQREYKRQRERETHGHTCTYVRLREMMSFMSL